MMVELHGPRIELLHICLSEDGPFVRHMSLPALRHLILREENWYLERFLSPYTHFADSDMPSLARFDYHAHVGSTLGTVLQHAIPWVQITALHLRSGMIAWSDILRLLQAAANVQTFTIAANSTLVAIGDVQWPPPPPPPTTPTIMLPSLTTATLHLCLLDMFSVLRAIQTPSLRHLDLRALDPRVAIEFGDLDVCQAIENVLLRPTLLSLRLVDLPLSVSAFDALALSMPSLERLAIRLAQDNIWVYSQEEIMMPNASPQSYHDFTPVLQHWAEMPVLPNLRSLSLMASTWDLAPQGTLLRLVRSRCQPEEASLLGVQLLRHLYITRRHCPTHSRIHDKDEMDIAALNLPFTSVVWRDMDFDGTSLASASRCVQAMRFAIDDEIEQYGNTIKTEPRPTWWWIGGVRLVMSSSEGPNPLPPALATSGEDCEDNDDDAKSTKSVIDLCTDEEDEEEARSSIQDGRWKEKAMRELQSTVGGAVRLFTASLEFHHAKEVAAVQRTLEVTRRDLQGLQSRVAHPVSHSSPAPITSVLGKRQGSQDVLSDAERESSVYDAIVAELLCTVCVTRLPTHTLEIPPEILSSIVQLIVDEEEGGITELERWPADPSDEEENMPIDERAIVRCPPAFINTRGFRQACRLWREVASSVKVKTFSVIVGRWCATAEEGLSLAKDIGAENIVIDTREDRHHQDRPDLLLAEEATMQRLLDSTGKWRSITLLLAYVPQLPRLPISFPSEPTLSSLDITFRKSVCFRLPHSIPLNDLLQKMDLRAVKALNIRNKGMLDVWLQKIIDDAIDILPSVTTIGLDVSLMRRHVLYPYFACSDVARAKVWEREAIDLSAGEEMQSVRREEGVIRLLLRNPVLDMGDTEDLSMKASPRILWAALGRIAASKLTRLVLYGPDVLASRRLPTTPDLSWVSQVPVLQELGLHGVGLEEHGLIQLLAGVATISRFEITQHPCTRWTSGSDAMDTPYYPHPVGPEIDLVWRGELGRRGLGGNA
ncbi:hypothetical protein K523DRAFT_413065 [Schizophyllum commune Tattone D]|nr:hypothetical protein K523DRAFT_413065 [Schizophyllum commune Tattone D]